MDKSHQSTIGMIDVTIMGPRGGRVKDIDEALIYNYIIEACKELKIRQADIEVLVYNKFPSDYDYAIGFCYGDIESVTIELTKEDDNMFLTLAHEMIHVKQFLNGQYPSEKEAKRREFELHKKVKKICTLT